MAGKSIEGESNEKGPLHLHQKQCPQPEGEYLEISALGFHGTLEASHQPVLPSGASLLGPLTFGDSSGQSKGGGQGDNDTSAPY
jgi:hypothetical protein